MEFVEGNAFMTNLNRDIHPGDSWPYTDKCHCNITMEYLLPCPSLTWSSWQGGRKNKQRGGLHFCTDRGRGSNCNDRGRLHFCTDRGRGLSWSLTIYLTLTPHYTRFTVWAWSQLQEVGGWKMILNDNVLLLFRVILVFIVKEPQVCSLVNIFANSIVKIIFPVP